MFLYSIKDYFNYFKHNIILAAIPIIIWITRFFYSNNFGLYEDDLIRIPPIMSMDANQVWNQIIHTSFVQGRPFHDGLIYVFSFLGFKIGGLQGIYFLAYLIVTTNCILFYFLLKKISTDKTIIVTGTLAFCLYPADTTQAFLTHSLGVQTSLTFFLIASHLYLSNRQKISYLFIILSLLCYETFFLIFLPIPLLRKNKKLPLTKELIKHSIILGIQLIIVVIIRKLTGESRVSEMTLSSTILTIMGQILLGPVISISMYIYRPLQILSTLQGQFLFFWLVIFMGIFLLIFSVNRLKIKEISSTTHLSFSQERKDFFNHLKKLILAGLAMLLLAYPLTFTVSVTYIDGRASRVHSAAIIGVSILIACVCSLILYLAKTQLINNFVIAIIVTFFSLLILFGINVQLDYQKSWQYDRQFWTDVVNLCPDLRKNTVVLVDAPLLWGKQINPFDWSMPSVLPNIYDFPSNWEFQPKLYKLESDWQSKILEKGKLALNNRNRALLFYYPWESERLVNSSEVILLEENEGKLVRRNTPIVIDKQNLIFKSYQLKQDFQFTTKPLYNYLIKQSEKDKYDYLLK